MTHAHVDPNHDSDSRPWLVEFDEIIRCKSERQSAAVKEVGISGIHQIIRTWLDAITPDARVTEPTGTPVRNIQFRRRLDARRFIATWGGRIVATASP